MKKGIAALVVIIAIIITLIACAEEEIQGLHCLFDIPMGITEDEFFTQASNTIDFPLEKSPIYKSRMSYQYISSFSEQPYTIAGFQVESVVVDFYDRLDTKSTDKNGINSGIYQGMHITITPPKKAEFSAGIRDFLNIVRAFETYFNDSSEIYVLTNTGWLHIPRLPNGAFDEPYINQMLSAEGILGISGDISNIVIASYEPKIEICGSTPLSIEFDSIGITQYDFIRFADNVPKTTVSIPGTTTRSIGEWECPAHIPAGEYIVTPIKSASIDVYRGGKLILAEFLSTRDNDEIGRLVLKSGDTIQIGSGKLEFRPFK